MLNPILGPGTSQLDRISLALREGYFNVDEMKLEHLLAFAADYAKLLTFYGPNNEPEGDWEPFFSSDEAVICTQILTTDLRQVESDFSGWLNLNAPQFRSGLGLSQANLQDNLNVIPAYRLAGQLDWWLNQLQFNQLRASENVESQDLSEKIAGAIDGKLRDELQSLAAFLDQFNANAQDTFRNELSGVWFVPGDSGVTQPNVPPPFDDGEGRHRVGRFLTLNFFSFYHAIALLQGTARSILSASLVNGAHSPATALYIAFLKLFEKAQDQVNRFTGRHLDFYYNDVLKAQRRPLEPDSTYLIFRPDVAERRVLIRAGREFLAGTDENNNEDVVYTADNDLLVHGARVQQLRTLYFERDPRKSPENQLGFASGAKSSQFPVTPPRPAADGESAKAWPLFGAPRSSSVEDFSHDAEIGFAIASPILYLAQGDRSVSFQFRIDHLAFIPFRESDFKDAATLVGKFREGTNELFVYLREQFTPETRILLENYEGATPSPALLQALAYELNQVCQRGPLYNAQRFRQVQLNPETMGLVEARPQGEELRRLNRLLLEEACPDELKSNQYLNYLLEELTGILRFSSREDAFFKAFSQMFTIHLSTEDGWLEIPEYLPLGSVVDPELAPDILKIQFRLAPEVAPVVSYSPEVHGGNYDTKLPLARFLIKPTSYLYPYDLLKNTVIKEVEVSAEVVGVRDIQVYNNLGQLDPNSPFNPFGPLPSVGSYWIVGSPEMARKQITRFNVNVEWGELPTTSGGFEDYYQAYQNPYTESLFEASVSVLSDGRWLPAEEHQQPRVKLFPPLDRDSRSTARFGTRAAQLTVGDGVTRFFNPAGGLEGVESFSYNSRAKNGFFKFTLSSPEYAFGHREYPQQLTRVLTENARLKDPRSFNAVPNPPYTPLVNAASVDYQAVSRVDLERVTSLAGNRPSERVFHVHPFGLESLAPDRYRTIMMAPNYEASGNLFIGLSARELSGTLTLFFHLREDCAPEAGEEPTGYAWSYLSSNTWIPLDEFNVTSDTTNGFLSSGVMTLNLPSGINTDNTVMPAGLFWLKVSVDEHPEYLCSVYSVHAQALKVTWRPEGNPAPTQRRRLPAGTIKEPRVSIPGIDRIDQIVDSFGGSPPESAERVKTRISERLRHKNRALAPWDYERLILEHFPDIFMVKCFANTVSDLSAPLRRGQILVVVIPDPRESTSINLRPTVNGLRLREISDFIEGISSPFATIQVRNPVYEQVQVRCTVKFREGAEGGYYINALNQAITDYLSPWITTQGYSAQFGWRVRRNDIESFIQDLWYVESLTNYSMLHIAEGDDDYSHLLDTVEGRLEQDEIRPLFPWSIAIPAVRHFIEITDSTRPIQPERTGIGELRIGTTLIVTGKNDHGA